MSNRSMDDGAAAQPRLEYFVLRIVRAENHSDAPLRGTIEQLGTQQKYAFANSAELLELLGGEPCRSQPSE